MRQYGNLTYIRVSTDHKRILSCPLAPQQACQIVQLVSTGFGGEGQPVACVQAQGNKVQVEMLGNDLEIELLPEEDEGVAGSPGWHFSTGNCTCAMGGLQGSMTS